MGALAYRRDEAKLGVIRRDLQLPHNRLVDEAEAEQSLGASRRRDRARTLAQKRASECSANKAAVENFGSGCDVLSGAIDVHGSAGARHEKKPRALRVGATPGRLRARVSFPATPGERVTRADLSATRGRLTNESNRNETR